MKNLVLAGLLSCGLLLAGCSGGHGEAGGTGGGGVPACNDVPCPPGAFSQCTGEFDAGAFVTSCCQEGIHVDACGLEVDGGAAFLSNTCPGCPFAPGTMTTYVCGYLTVDSPPICNIFGQGK